MSKFSYLHFLQKQPKEYRDAIAKGWVDVEYRDSWTENVMQGGCECCAGYLVEKTHPAGWYGRRKVEKKYLWQLFNRHGADSNLTAF